MVYGCVVKTIKDLNQLLSPNGISDTISPSTMITGRSGPYFNQFNELNLRDYVQAIRRRGRTDTNRARTVGAIALYPSGHDQGGWFIMSLATAKECTVTSRVHYQ